MKVLVLEDDPALRFALTQFLDGLGYTVYEAGDIATACAILGNVQPDLLLLDLMIGSVFSIPVADMAGYRAPEADVIYLTGSNKFPNGELFHYSPNTSWVLRKPVDFIELKAMLGYVHKSRSTSAIGLS